VRLVNAAAASPERAQKLAATLTAGAVSAAALGMVAFTSDSSMASNALGTTAAPAVSQTNVAAPLIASIGSQLSPPESAEPADAVTTAGAAPDTETTPASARHGKGCGHHPVPVGPRSGATGPPGGCLPG